MFLPPLPRTLTLHPTPLSLRRVRADRDTPVVVLDGDMTFADLWPHFEQPGEGQTLTPALARRWVRHVLLAGKVPAWQRHAADVGAVQQIYEAVMELRTAGITPATLAASDKLGPWAELLAGYEAVLQACNCVDAADRQRSAVLQIAQGRLPPVLRAVERVEVLAGTELLGSRLDALRAFAAQGMAVRVHMPWDEERPHAFAWTEALLHALETRAGEGIHITFAPRRGRGALRPVVAALYARPESAMEAPPRPASLPGAGRGEPLGTDAPVVVRRVPEGLRHAESVVAQIAAWLTAGVPAGDIAVVAPQIAAATEIVRALGAAGIGCAHTLHRSVAQSRIARLYLGGLRSHAGHAPGAWWVALWEACGTPVHTPEGVWRPERVARALRRAGLADERPWHPQQAQAALCPPAVARAMLRLCAPLSDLPRSGPPAAWAEALMQWARHLAQGWRGLAGQGAADGAACAQGFAPATPPHAHAALEAALRSELEACAALQQCILEVASCDPAPADAWSRAEIADEIAACCADKALPSTMHDARGVHVLRPDEAVGGRFRRLVFAGADMESFPRPLPANPFLPEFARTEINRLAGPRLLQYSPMTGRGTLPAISRDLWLWLEVANTVSEQWVVTVPEPAGDALLGPCEPVDELLRTAGISMTATPPDGLVDRVAPRAWMPRLWAAHPQALQACMQQVNADVALRLQRRRRAGAGRASQARVPQAVAAAWRHYLENTVHSASRIDALGLCAFRYVAAAVWGLGPDDEVTLGATPRAYGSAAHAALHHVYAALMRTGGLREARLTPERALAQAAGVMADQEAHILAETHVHPLLQSAFLAETAVTTLAQLQADMAGTDAEPVALEYVFDDRYPNAPDALCLQHPQGHLQLRVRGSIDRVDVSEHGVTVLDYKRKSRSRQPDRHFQLALYAAVALRDLRPEAGRVRMGWAGLLPAKTRWADDMPESPQAMLRHLRNILFARVDPLLQGEFSPDPDTPSTCEHCDFRRLCRRDDISEPSLMTAGRGSELADG